MAGMRQKLGEGVVNWLGEMGGKVKDAMSPDTGGVRVDEPKPASTDAPVAPQTNMEAAPPMNQQELDDSIQELGAQGQLGPREAAELTGRDKHRRNINLDFFEDESTKKTIHYINELNEGFLDNPIRDVKTHKETLAKSIKGAEDGRELRDRISRVTGSPIEEKWETEDLVGIYQLMEVQAVELQDFAKELKAQRNAGIEPSTEDLAHYQLITSRFTAVQEIASVRAAEAGRMLNSLKAVAKGGESQYYKDLDNIVRGAGGPRAIWAQIDRVTEAGDLKDIAAAARDGWFHKSAKALTTLRYNMMLSSVRTHVANVGGSFLTGAWEITAVNTAKIAVNNSEYVGRYLLNKAIGTPAMRQQDRIRLSEVVSVPYHTIASMRAGFARFKGVASGAEMGHGKVYNELGIRPQQGPGFLPTNLLEAEDAFFRSTFLNAKVRQLAHRQALQTAETDADVDKVFQSLLKSPPDAMLREAEDYAGKLTFTNDPSYYGNVLGGFGKVLSTAQDVPVVGRWFLPFVRTPTNLLGYAMDTTGIYKVTFGIDKFKADLQNPETRADAESRLLIAYGLYHYLHSYWEEGKITGAAPKNYGVTRAREAVGWRENSIRIGDEYVELNRVDPLGLIMATYATMYEAEAHLTETDLPTEAVAGMIQVANMITDRSVLSGLSQLSALFDVSPGSAGKQTGKTVSRIATSFVIPAIVRDVREMVDPSKRSMEARDTLGEATYDSFTSAFMNSIPLLSENVPPQVNAFGEDKVNTGHFMYRGLVPLRRDKIEQDPVAVALIATGVPINKPDSEIKFSEGRGPSVKLLDLDGGKGWVYRDYQQWVGRMRHQMLGRLTGSEQWKRLAAAGQIGPDTPAADLVMDIVKEARRLATDAFLQAQVGKKTITTATGEVVDLDMVFTMEEYKYYKQEMLSYRITKDVKREAGERGLKVPMKAQQQGLPPEMRF